jgi:aryl-alcohol dehydrogenase-like predicted oxidoreductase
VLVMTFGQFQREGQGNGIDGRPEYVMRAREASMSRLGVDTIDL